MITPTVTSIDATLNSETQIINNIKNAGSEKTQLKKVAQEFESVFVTQMLNMMEKTVEKEGGMFEEGHYMKNFKSFVFNEIGREISSNPKTSIGFAEQIYKQMEKSVKE